MTVNTQFQPVTPNECDTREAKRAVRRINDYLADHPGADQPVRLNVEGDPEDVLVVPRAAVDLFAKILAHMAAGQMVNVIPVKAELTTQDAADLLNVSRPYLIRLLDEGKIPHHRVGNRRRVYFTDLMNYKRQDDAKRRAVVDELAKLSQELDLD